MKKKRLAGTMAVVLVLTGIIMGTACSGQPLGPKTAAEQKTGEHSQPEDLPVIFSGIAGKFAGVDIPVYAPAYLPGNGPYGIANFRTTKDSYSFEVIKGDHPDLEESTGPVSMADSVVVVSASDNPFSPYLTEEELLAKPSGTVEIGGVTANTYGNGMEVVWSAGNWLFFAVGEGEQEGTRVAREIMEALQNSQDLLTEPVDGKFRASRLGNATYVTASWTYDGKTWYTLDGRSSPGERIKMLESVTPLTDRKPLRTAGYYPQVPEKITSPEMALEAYFGTLYFASNLTLEQMSAAGGTVGMDKEPYQTAYSYWSKGWREKNSYEQFLASWAGTAHVALLKLLPAGAEKDEKCFFVETKHLEVTDEKLGIFYYTGFFTVRETSEGWKITGGKLEAENLGWELGGHQPWRADAEQVALVSGLGSIDAPLGEAVTIENPDGTVTVRFADAQGKEMQEVILYQPEDGIWRVLDKKGFERQSKDEE